MSALHQTLAWLKPAPSDFRARLRKVLGAPEPGRALQALCNHALSADQLEAVSRALRKMREAGMDLAPLQPFKLALLGNGTLDYAQAAIEGTGPRFGFAIECVRCGYDQALQDAVSPNSDVNTAGVDAALVALDWRGVPLQCEVGREDAAEAAAGRAAAYLAQVCAGVRQHGGAVPIVQTLAAPPEALFGALDRLVPGTAFDLVQRLNRRLAETYDGSGGLLLDVGRLAETVGGANWFDPGLWNLAKAPFALDWTPLWADHLGRLIAAIKGRSRKGLVLDLDNTLWGGVVGDDGMDGIVLAQGDAAGEAFLSLQAWALALRERGIVLAVSSKNDDAVARRVFREHPEMLLREDHIAVFQANWRDKASNIAAIADELSLGLDSLVFVDDNPAERERVRQALPQVAVPELPEDPALFARTLAAAGYFEAIAFSEEDRQRAAFYQQNAQRAAMLADAGGLEAFLQSLDMQIDFRRFDPVNRSRIAQLINKSNQFNLTTRRYTEAEVAALEADAEVFTLQARLTDVFGDNGMISVVICRPDGAGRWRIDTWLMSCRVLGRKVEDMVLKEVVREARRRGVGELIGVYRPTDRNGLVADHYRKLGFEPAPAEGDETHWRLATDIDLGADVMRVVRPGERLEAAQ
jgi:FkbH-like protein